MKKLIIITGCSGSGKTVLAKSLNENLENSTLLSLDTMLEMIYDLVGFKNIDEKKDLRKFVVRTYKSLLREVLKRGDPIVIIEYPFKKKWLRLFESLRDEFGYEIYTINMLIEDYDAHWNNLVKREMNDRHRSHYLQSYNVKNKENYEPHLEFDYEKHKRGYESKKMYDINLGKVIDVADISLVDIQSLVKQILE